MLALFPVIPKRDQNLKSTPLSERTGIPVCFIQESYPWIDFSSKKVIFLEETRRMRCFKCAQGVTYPQIFAVLYISSSFSEWLQNPCSLVPTDFRVSSIKCDCVGKRNSSLIFVFLYAVKSRNQTFNFVFQFSPLGRKRNSTSLYALRFFIYYLFIFIYYLLFIYFLQLLKKKKKKRINSQKKRILTFFFVFRFRVEFGKCITSRFSFSACGIETGNR